MDFLTKRCLYVFLLFFIICDSVTSDPFEDCKRKVFKKFPEYEKPFGHFKHAFYSYNLNNFPSGNKEALGYFKYLVTPIKEFGPNIILSPKNFCTGKNTSEIVLNADPSKCYEALSLMITPKNSDKKLEVKEMGGNEALKHVYQNQIYHKLLVVQENLAFPESNSSADEQTILEEQWKVDVMIEYFNRLYSQAVNFAPDIFPNIDQYCTKVVAGEL